MGEHRITCGGCGALTNDLDEYQGQLRCPRCRAATHEIASGLKDVILIPLKWIIGAGISFGLSVLVYTIIKMVF